jgi:hypothetical protein
MNDPTRPPTLPLQQQSQPDPRAPRFAMVRGWLRSRTGRIVVPLIALLVGLGLGFTVIFLYGTIGEGQTVNAPSPGKGDIIVEADKVFLTELVTNNLRASGMPGDIKNVEVELAHGDQMTIKGDDVLSVLGVGVTKHFTLVVQPYVLACVLQIHVTHADLNSIPVTGFASIFENHINDELRKKPAGLPGGFQYCTTGVRTEPSAMFITYSATPI